MSNGPENTERPIACFEVDECQEFEAVLVSAWGRPELPPPPGPNDPVLTVEVDYLIMFEDEAIPPRPPSGEPPR